MIQYCKVDLVYLLSHAPRDALVTALPHLFSTAVLYITPFLPLVLASAGPKNTKGLADRLSPRVYEAPLQPFQ